MAERYPVAIYIGTAEILNYWLVFKGGQWAKYLSIEPYRGASVPVVVWSISETDEVSLDCHEGFPNFYYKKTIKDQVLSMLDGKPIKTVNAMIYIICDGRQPGTPSPDNYCTCRNGYRFFNFDVSYLENALRASVGETEVILGGVWIY